MIELKNYISVDGSYGGYQSLFGNGTIGSFFGCGAVALTDCLVYKNIFAFENRKEYVRILEKVYKAVKPNQGINFLRGPFDQIVFNFGLGTYSKRKVIRAIKKLYDENAEIKYLNNNSSSKEALDFINLGILQNMPVMMLSYADESNYKFHWVNITGVDIIHERVIISTWGEKRRITDFPKYWRRKSLFNKKILVAFN